MTHPVSGSKRPRTHEACDYVEKPQLSIGESCVKVVEGLAMSALSSPELKTPPLAKKCHFSKESVIHYVTSEGKISLKWHTNHLDGAFGFQALKRHKKSYSPGSGIPLAKVIRPDLKGMLELPKEPDFNFLQDACRKFVFDDCYTEMPRDHAKNASSLITFCLYQLLSKTEGALPPSLGILKAATKNLLDQKNHETVSLSKDIFADLIKTPSPKIDDYRSLVFAHQERYFKNVRGTISSFDEKSLGLWKSFGSILQTSADGKTSLFPDPKPTYFNPHDKNEGAVPLDVLRAPQFHYLLKEFPKEGSSFKDPRIDFVQFSQNTLRFLHKKIDNLFAHKQFISLLTKFDIRE